MNIRKGDTVMYRATGENGEITNYIGKVVGFKHHRFLDIKRWNTVKVDWGKRWQIDSFLPKEITVLRRKKKR